TQTIRSRVAVAQVVASDLDGDHRPEIIARDTGSGLQIWRHGRRGFRSYRAKRILPIAIGHGNRRHFDDGPTVPGGAVTGQRVGNASPAPERGVVLTPPDESPWRQPHSRAPDSLVVPWNAVPRPPPSSRLVL